jgi:hypothetical protein
VGGEGGVARIRWWLWWGVTLANARREKGLRAKLAKSSRWGLISRAPLEIGVEIGGGRWFGHVNEVVVMVRRCIRKHEAGEGGEGQNCEIELLGFDLKRAIGNWGRDQWGEVVRWRR